MIILVNEPIVKKGLLRVRTALWPFQNRCICFGAIIYAMTALTPPNDLITIKGFDRLVGEQWTNSIVPHTIKASYVRWWQRGRRPAPLCRGCFAVSQTLSLYPTLPLTPLPLCVFTPGQIDTDSVSASQKVLNFNFGLNQVICPLLILGSQGQRFIEGLLRQNWEEAEDQLRQVYVWPRPLMLGPVVVLLWILKGWKVRLMRRGEQHW